MEKHKRKDRHNTQEKSAPGVTIETEENRPKKKQKKETTVARQDLKLGL